MNERIKELAEQATNDVKDEFGHWINSEFNKEKFAELIVRECIDIAGKEDFDVMMKEGYPCSQTAKKIKQHFGVAQSNIEIAESYHSDKGYSLGTPEAQESFERKRGYKL